jgi:hypothetical protein
MSPIILVKVPGVLEHQIDPGVCLPLEFSQEGVLLEPSPPQIYKRLKTRNIVVLYLGQKDRSEVDCAMHIRIPGEQLRHGIIILRRMSANPWCLKLIFLGVCIQRLMLMPDEVQVERRCSFQRGLGVRLQVKVINVNQR